MPEQRLERTRRAYDKVIDMRPYGCRIVDVGAPDYDALNRVWQRALSNVSVAYRITQAQRAAEQQMVDQSLKDLQAYAGRSSREPL